MKEVLGVRWERQSRNETQVYNLYSGFVNSLHKYTLYISVYSHEEVKIATITVEDIVGDISLY